MSSTTILILAVILLFGVHGVVTQMRQKRRLQREKSRLREVCEHEVADEMASLRSELRELRLAGERTNRQLRRCRETLQKILRDIEVLG